MVDQPTAPPGSYATLHKRAEGYANYKVGCWYLSPDDVALAPSCQSFLCLLKLKNKLKSF